MTKTPRRILVVDDDEDILLMLRRLVTAQGYECGLARNGQEALEALAASRYWLVVLDVMMRVVDGREVAARIKDDPRYGYPHVVILTGRGDLETAAEGFETGVTFYLTKPFSTKRLVETIAAIEELG